MLLKRKYNRVVPLNDLVTDRWEKAQYLGFGENTSIYDSSYVYGDVKVGKDTWIGPFTVLDGSGGLQIGSNCSISAGVHIYSHSTVLWAVSGGKEPYEYRQVSIGDNCFIGPQAIIQYGVSIGNSSIIGANSFVNKDIPDHAIAAGNPAKVIGEVIIKNGSTELIYFKDAAK
jgi:acetyltransferase-like isoleucine patch superfamily enzyme